jgi:hypothetical protein
MTDGDRLSLLNDPEHWKKQAAEMRKLAAGSRDDVRASLLKIADEYDALVRKAEKRRSETLVERKA